MAAAKAQGSQISPDVEVQSVEVQSMEVHSMGCIRHLPPSGDELGGHVDPADPDWLFFAIGFENRRISITPGMHVDQQHPVVTAYKDYWSPSPEVVDTRVIRQLGVEARGRHEIERYNRTWIPATWIEVGCARDGWRSGLGVMMSDPIPARRWAAAQLSPYRDDHHPADVAESAYMQRWHRLRVKAQRELAEKKKEAAALNHSCPDDVEPLDRTDLLYETQLVERAQRAPARSG